MTGEIRGRVASGVGQGRHFTRLPWALEQFVGRLGIDPWPGTFNIVVDDPTRCPYGCGSSGLPGFAWKTPNDGPHDCDARCYPVRVDGRIDGAIVYPEVEDYPPAQVEIVAEVDLREALGVEDGDSVTLTIQRVGG